MLNRPQCFLLFTMLAFFAPLLLFGTSLTFIVVVPFTILIWFAARWQEIAKIEKRSHLLEMLLAVGIYVSNIVRNVLGFLEGFQGIGLFDMFVAFVAVCLAFYGFKGFKHFVLPAAYLSIMIVGYQLEFAITEIAFLQNFLAHLMASMLNLFTIGASASGNLVTVCTREGVRFLAIDASCTGFKGMLAYGSLAILMILDVKATRRRKLPCVTIGAIGTFLVSILRLLSVFLAVYFFGMDVGLAVHTYIGYGFFIGWVLLFWAISFKYLLPAPTRSDIL